MKFILQPWHFAFVLVAAWVNLRQQQIIEFQNAQIEALLKKLDKKRVLLTDDQRRLLAVKGKALGRKAMMEVTTTATTSRDSVLGQTSGLMVIVLVVLIIFVAGQPRGTKPMSITSATMGTFVIMLSLSSLAAAGLYVAPPDPVNAIGGYSSVTGRYQQIVQDFAVSTRGVANTISIYGYFFLPDDSQANQNGSFVLEFFDDNAGTPETNSTYSFITDEQLGVYAGIDNGFRIYEWEFTVPNAPSLNPGETYWFGAKSANTNRLWAWTWSSGDGVR